MLKVQNLNKQHNINEKVKDPTAALEDNLYRQILMVSILAKSETFLQNGGMLTPRSLKVEGREFEPSRRHVFSL